MSSAGTRKIYVIFYTTYGHIYKMVEQVSKGINSVPGTEAVVLQVMYQPPVVLWCLLERALLKHNICVLII